MSFTELFKPDHTELAEHYPNRAERLADMIVHVVGLVGGAVAAGVLFTIAAVKGGATLSSAVALYAMCMMVMFTCSAVYNLSKRNSARRLLRRLDEAAIFLMIAGSYTPFAMQLLPASLAVTVTTGVWACAFAGALGKIFWPQISDAAWCVIYLAYAWIGVAVLLPAVQGMPELAMVMLATGGVIYTAGVLIYLNQKIPYRRAIWHAIVVLGAALHYGAILTGVVMRAA
jgi:hemolysin III